MPNVLLLLPVGKTKPRKQYKGNNAFGVLGILPQSSMKVVKRAYLELAAQWHPDKNPSPEAKNRFIKINTAYNFIVRGGDLARYLVLCNIVLPKQKFSESLMNVKRTKILTGIDIERPKTFGEAMSKLKWVNISKEEWNQQISLLFALQFRCPSCKWKEGCDRVTGFIEVKDVYDQMIKESYERVFGSLK